MSRNKKYKSDAFEAIHETAEGLFESGLMKKKTMRKFDKACLGDAPEFAPGDIKELREREKVSQPVFAHCLNISRNLVSDWERGVKKPGGPALRLLQIVKKQGLSVTMQV